MPLSVQKQYLPVRGRKLPRFMGGRIGPEIEIFETSGLSIPMVPRLHKSIGYIKRKLRVWRTQKCIALVCAETVLISMLQETTPFHGGQYMAGIEIFETAGPPIHMVPRLHQSNGYIKRKLRAFRAQKCFAHVFAETVITSAGPKTTPFHGGQYRSGMEIRETSGVLIGMVLHFHKRNVYIIRKLRVWRNQKFIALVCGKNPQICAGLQTSLFHVW